MLYPTSELALSSFCHFAPIPQGASLQDSPSPEEQSQPGPLHKSMAVSDFRVGGQESSPHPCTRGLSGSVLIRTGLCKSLHWLLGTALSDGVGGMRAWPAGRRQLPIKGVQGAVPQFMPGCGPMALGSPTLQGLGLTWGAQVCLGSCAHVGCTFSLSPALPLPKMHCQQGSQEAPVPSIPAQMPPPRSSPYWLRACFSSLCQAFAATTL